MGYFNDLLEAFKDFPQEIQERVQQHQREYEEEIIRHERTRSVMKAADAFLEAGVSKECAISLLQKHWDLRLSEAEKALWQAENRKNRE